MSHIDILNPPGASERLRVRRGEALTIAEAQLAAAREAERNAYLYMHIAVAALVMAIALVTWVLLA